MKCGFKGYELARQRYLRSVRGDIPHDIRCALTDEFVLLTQREVLLRTGAPHQEVKELDKPLQYLRQKIRTYYNIHGQGREKRIYRCYRD